MKHGDIFEVVSLEKEHPPAQGLYPAVSETGRVETRYYHKYPKEFNRSINSQKIVAWLRKK